MDYFDERRLRGEEMPSLDVSVYDYERGATALMSSAERKLKSTVEKDAEATIISL